MALPGGHGGDPQLPADPQRAARLVALLAGPASLALREQGGFEAL